MADSAKINEALRQLDTENDNHWTQQGEPRLETVRLLAGDGAISRADIDSATKDYNRQAARDAKATGTTPQVTDAGAPGGAVTGDPIPPVPTVGETGIAITPPVDADGNQLPTDVPPLPSAPAADGLPTAAEPAMTEGGEPTDRAQNADTASHDVEGSVEAGRPPQITQGTTEKGYNALNSEQDDIIDAQASTAPSPNAPAELGGAPDARQAGGLTNEAGTDESTEQRPGEAQLSPVDRGADGDSDAVASLEAELETVTKQSAKLRGIVDDAQGELARSTAEESRIRVEIEKARPRGGTMPAIQDYFTRLDEVATAQADVKKRIQEAGVDFGQLKKIMDNPITGDIK